METETKERVPWVPLIVLAIIYSFVAPLWGFLLPWGAVVWYGISRSACHMLLMTGAYLLTLLAASMRFMRPLRNRLNPAFLTYVFAIASTMGYVGVIDGFPIVDWYTSMLSDRNSNPVLAEQFWPSFWAPSSEVVQQIISGGQPIAWGAWLPNILYWGSLFAAFGVFTATLSNIFRRTWIDIEKLPFPQVMVGYEIISRFASSDGERTLLQRLGRPFLLGTIVGIIVQFPLFMTYAFPWFPDLYGWRTNMCLTGAMWVPSTSPLAAILGIASYQKHPIYAAIAYLVPLSISFNVWFWTLVMAALVQVAFALGYYTGLPAMDSCGRVWCGTETLWKAEPFRFVTFSDVGMVLGILVMYLFLHRGYVVETLRAAFGRIPSERLKEIEYGEPMSYRNSYAILAASFVVLVSLCMASGVTVIPAILMVITGTIWMFVAIMVFGLVGLGFPTSGHSGTVIMKLYFGDVPPEPMTREWMVSVAGLTRYPFCQGLCKGFGAGFVGGFSSYKMANLTGVSPKSLYKVVLLAVVIAPFVANISFIWATSAFGWSSLPGIAPFVGTSYIDGWASAESAATDPGPSPFWPQALAGFLIAIILGVLHARYIWFPFEPIGLFIATEEWELLAGLWTTFLVAWIAKLLTLRIGGSKAYENYGVPFASGFVTGFTIIGLIGGAILVLRFFVPF